jgi:hypothetical protein
MGSRAMMRLDMRRDFTCSSGKKTPTNLRAWHGMAVRGYAVVRRRVGTPKRRKEEKEIQINTLLSASFMRLWRFMRR